MPLVTGTPGISHLCTSLVFIFTNFNAYYSCTINKSFQGQTFVLHKQTIQVYNQRVISAGKRFKWKGSTYGHRIANSFGQIAQRIFPYQ